MKIKWEELKNQGISSTQVNEITKGDMTQAFGVTEEQMQKAAEILGKNEGSKKSGIHQPDYQKCMDQKTTATVQKKQRKRYISYK